MLLATQLNTNWSYGAPCNFLQDVRNHMYDTPLHSREPSADQTAYSSTLYPPPTSPPTNNNSNSRNRQYHTLERPQGTPPMQRFIGCMYALADFLALRGFNVVLWYLPEFPSENCLFSNWHTSVH